MVAIVVSCSAARFCKERTAFSYRHDALTDEVGALHRAGWTSPGSLPRAWRTGFLENFKTVNAKGRQNSFERKGNIRQRPGDLGGYRLNAVCRASNPADGPLSGSSAA